MFFKACRQTHIMDDLRCSDGSEWRFKGGRRPDDTLSWIHNHYHLLCIPHISPEANHPHSRAPLVFASRVHDVCVCVCVCQSFSASHQPSSHERVFSSDCGVHPPPGRGNAWVVLWQAVCGWQLQDHHLTTPEKIPNKPFAGCRRGSTCGWAAAAGIPPLILLFFIFCSVFWQLLLFIFSLAGSQQCRRCSSGRSRSGLRH